MVVGALGAVALGGCDSSGGGAASKSGANKTPAATPYTDKNGQPLPPPGQAPGAPAR